ncbi:ubiquitin-associated/translation elongation factor EF1B protein [Wolffia australiana]
MSMEIRSKPKDKSLTKLSKDKSPLKLSAVGICTVPSVPGSAYNPISGKFHSLDLAPSSSSSRSSIRSQAAADRGEEFDSISTESCSGESQEDSKESLPVPGAGDVDKRDKTRQKNERKHQRQRRRRAEELSLRCAAFLMSRKLELLAQQLVSMGFPHGHATTALLATKGSCEEAVAWMLDTGDAVEKPAADDQLRININDELAKMTKIEAELRCSKQDLHKAVVASEGDVEKAAETLRASKHELPLPPPGDDARLGLIRSPPPKPRVPVQPQQPQQQRRQEQAARVVPASVSSRNKPVLPQTLKLPVSEAKGRDDLVILDRRQCTPPWPANVSVSAEMTKVVSPLSPPLVMPSSLGLFRPATNSWGGRWASMASDYNYVDWSTDSAATPWRPMSAIGRGPLLGPAGFRLSAAATSAVADQHGGAFPVDLSEGVREWTNAFAGRDMFSLSRKLAMSSP